MGQETGFLETAAAATIHVAANGGLSAWVFNRLLKGLGECGHR